MKKVTIINAYGDKNIGDAAILKVALDCINEAHENKCRISVLCEDTRSFSDFITKSSNSRPFQLPYGYAIRGEKKVSTMKKIARFTEICIVTAGYLFLNKHFNFLLPQKDFYAYIAEIKNADSIIGMGGGYLTTNTTKDYFGLFLTLLPIYIAKWYRKPILFLPMSFGPFATAHQEKIALNGVKNTTVIARDQISLDILKKRGMDYYEKLFYAPDLALFLGNQGSTLARKLKNDYIVLTAREWFPNKEKQNLYEKSLTLFVNYAWDTYQLKTVFIPMARNKVEDDDNRVAQRILNGVIHKNVFSIFHPKSIEDVQKTLKNARVAICTRMHSAILATTVQTPFIAIGYGHKTLGFVKDFNLEKWHIDISDLTYKSLVKLFNSLMEELSYIEFIKTTQLQQNINYSYKAKITDVIKKPYEKR